MQLLTELASFFVDGVDVAVGVCGGGGVVVIAVSGAE